ncbi:hypothetical protein [Reichenbachiella versicolor]|uniref:hypothetical protein n=1 Tax=Reichenbachiella versicolor TaxID=1821036 RepID=UPI000D6E0C81|nr:hypothetical protein [Reichenbachiella versicolor]
MKKLLYLSTLVILLACEEELKPSDSFTKIYDTKRSDIKYEPVDVVEIEEGFIILAKEDREEITYAGVQLMVIDEDGNFLKAVSMDDNHVLPTGNFVTIEDRNYFLAMNPSSLDAEIVSVDDSLNIETVTLSGIQYPLAFNKTSDNQFLVLSYSLDDGETVLSLHDINGVYSNGHPFTTGAGNDVTDDIINHYLDPQRSGLPFKCGEVSSGSYYFNGFYNFSFSMVFNKLAAPTGVIQGQGTNGGMTAILPVDGSNFAIFGFQFNDNFYQPLQSIDINSTTSSIDYLTLPASEYIARTAAKIVSYENETKYTVIAAETQSRQVNISFYEAETGELKGSRNIGFINPFNLSSVRVDSENNLLILGSTLVSGRFQRAFLNKIHSSEIEDILN